MTTDGPIITSLLICILNGDNFFTQTSKHIRLFPRVTVAGSYGNDRVNYNVSFQGVFGSHREPQYCPDVVCSKNILRGCPDENKLFYARPNFVRTADKHCPVGPIKFLEAN